MDASANSLLPERAAQAIAAAILGRPITAAELIIDPPVIRPNGTIAMAMLKVGEAQHELVIKSLPRHLHEAAAYRCLTQAGAPVATMYMDFMHRGREVIVLERLPRIGHTLEPGEFAAVITALARFNAVAPPTLPAPKPGWLVQQLSVWRMAWQRALAGAWGGTMAECAAPLVDAWDDLERLAVDIERELAELPLAATHHDPCLGNCGWNADGEVRFIDLGYVTRHALFADVTIKLGRSADPWPSSDGREPWIALYCDVGGQAGMERISMRRALRAVAVQAASLSMWLDEPTWSRADAELVASPPANTLHGWAWWFARTWRRLAAMRDMGITGADAD
jgi:hypothetical protein